MGKTWIFKITKRGFDFFFTSDDLSYRNRNPNLDVLKDVHWDRNYDKFVSVLYDKNWPSQGSFTTRLTFWPGNVIDDVMSV